MSSAVHAVQPLVPRGEVPTAGGFGLMHGLAFARLIGDLGLDRGSLGSTLLRFNLGIELTQLLVVALMIPSLIRPPRVPHREALTRLVFSIPEYSNAPQ